MVQTLAIRATGLSKRYLIGETGAAYGRLTESIWNGIRRPFGGARDATPREHIWALRDVDLDVARGEIVGLIGRNGAGKTTLLKILSRTTEPTEGRATLKGRVGSLLEVGTGFHQELTGRENISLYGAILGMSRAEIRRKFDQIVGFAEVEKFIDTPVKRYSTGMYVRLAFSVAAHLEPEILLVDEVLAVGDAAFQQKCLGKMGDIAAEGRTVVFVSHNMGIIGRLCHRGVVLHEGRVTYSGGVDDAISDYLQTVATSVPEVLIPADPTKRMQARAVRLLNGAGEATTDLDRRDSFRFLIEYEVRAATTGAHIALLIDKADGTPVCHSYDIDDAPNGVIVRQPGLYRTEIEFPGAILNAGTYQLRLGIARFGGEIYDRHGALFMFNLHDRGSHAAVGGGGQQRPGVLALPLEWKTELISRND